MRLNLAKINFSKFRIKDRDNEGSTIPFTLNPPQQYLHQELQKKIDRGEPPWAIVLKARRVGISTDCSILNVCHCTAFANAAAMTVAHRAKNSKSLFREARAGHATVCSDAGLALEDLRTQHELTFPHAQGASLYSFATAKTVEGARGLTLTALHLSEAAFYEQAEDAFTALISTVAYRPDTMILIESTANGKTEPGETFYQYWMDAVEGRNQFTPIFISWLMDPGCQMDPDVNEVEPGNLDDEEKELVEQHHASLAQISWRRWAIPNRCQGYVDKFHQEYPHTAEVAFLTSGDPAFTPEEMKAAENTLKKPKFYGDLVARTMQ